MKHFFTIILIALCLNFSFAQDKQDGPFKDYYDSGEIKVEGQYENKKKVGEWKSYHKNGQISRLYSYDKGKLNKEEISYYEDGMVSSKTEKEGDNFVNRAYSKSGRIQHERQVGSGYYKKFFENGNLKIEANYKDYELIDEWKQYYENGEIEWLVTYMNGYRSGSYKNYYKNGDLKLEGTNYRDKVDGEEKRYLPNNILHWKGSYSKGVFSKKWILYDAKGNKSKKIKFKDGVVTNSKNKGELSVTKIPVGVLEKVPVYPGCEDFLTNRNRNRCMNMSIAQFVKKNFNTDIGNALNIKGRQRIDINFKIDKTGVVKSIEAKTQHAVLKIEAIRVIRMLPKMEPGMQRGRSVSVLFALPLVFQMQ